MARQSERRSQRGDWLPWAVLGILTLVLGCQAWPGNQAMRQYQLESDRLLSEFRSQKKRAEELEQRNYQLEQRLGESEKLIARLQGRSNSRVADSSGRTDSRTLADLSNNPVGTSKKIPGLGLPDDTPGTAGRLTSGVGAGTLNGDPARSNQWRPITGR
ncbi:MAG: hypothetical protein FJ308_06495 [Planctomycetes bacterium]|nr:hypothetical protein [Planctomycetota bacterium]